MSAWSPVKNRIIRALDDLPPESLTSVAEFVEFLRIKVSAPPRPGLAPRRVKLGGLWKGYGFSEEEIRAARQEVWASLGRGFDA